MMKNASLLVLKDMMKTMILWLLLLENEDEVINKLNTFLAPVPFHSKSTNFIFQLISNQLMMEKGVYIFIRVVFSNHEDKLK